MSEARPRILHIITKLAVGGAQYNTLISTRDISEKGYPSDILTGPEKPPEGDLFDLAEEWGLNVMIAPHLKRSISPINDLLAMFEIRRSIKKGKYDIVHTHGSKARFLGRLAAARLKNVITVQTAHGWPFWETQQRFRRWLYTALERFGFYTADATIVVSKKDIPKAVKYGIGRETDYRLIRSGVDLAPFVKGRNAGQNSKEFLELDPNKKVVGSVMRFCREKAPDVMIRVAERVLISRPDVIFVFVGDGPLYDETRETASKLGLFESIIFLGNRSDVEKILPAFDVFLLTSRTEGLPRTLLESLACEVPVVSTDAGGISELVSNGRNGILCPIGDIDALTSGVLRLLENEELGSELLETVDEDLVPFTASKMVEQLFDLYGRLADGGMKIVFLCDNEPFHIPQCVLSIIRARPEHKYCIIELPGHGSIRKHKDNFKRYFGLYGPLRFILQLFKFISLKISAYLNLPTAKPHSLHQTARRTGSDFVRLGSINSNDSVDLLKSIEPDLLISVACPQILKKRILRIPSKGAWNVHSSVLPRNRGMLPSFWSLCKKEQPGVTVHQMVRKLDDGGILLQEKLDASVFDTSLHQLIKRSKELAAKLIIKSIDLLETDTQELLPNPYDEATFNTFPLSTEVKIFRELGGKICGKVRSRRDIALSFDLEEWFQTAAARRIYPYEKWSGMRSSFESAVEKILLLLDEYDSKATFFTLGWILEKYPEVINRIAEEGHEIGYHGYNHVELHQLSRKEFKNNLDRFLSELEHLNLKRTVGFRAPSFSLKGQSAWAIDEIAEHGFLYDSSVYPMIKMRYGLPDAPRRPFILKGAEHSITELPMASVSVLGSKIPVAGGAYLRFYPAFLHRIMLNTLSSSGIVPVLYFHPWEIDSRNISSEMGFLQRVRQHHNSGENTIRKLRAILRRFRGITLNELYKQVQNREMEVFNLVD